jgi:Pyridoxamine 5'-phosphate oxidase
MAKQRDLVSMSAPEVSAFLASSRKVQLGTLNPDGSVHLVTMFYGLIDGQVAFWTYRTSQKALNLARDPRITCLVEDGSDYFELRGVQLRGTVRVVTEYEDVLAIGRLVAGGMATGLGGPGADGPGVGGSGLSDSDAADAVEAYVAQAARKRLGYIVSPDRIVSWDHSKLLT